MREGVHIRLQESEKHTFNFVEKINNASVKKRRKIVPLKSLKKEGLFLAMLCSFVCNIVLWVRIKGIKKSYTVESIWKRLIKSEGLAESRKIVWHQQTPDPHPTPTARFPAPAQRTSGHRRTVRGDSAIHLECSGRGPRWGAQCRAFATSS